METFRVGHWYSTVGGEHNAYILSITGNSIEVEFTRIACGKKSKAMLNIDGTLLEDFRSPFDLVLKPSE